jgi:hypothetical protein
MALTPDGMVRCTVADFKGKTYVNLRTYYMVRALCARLVMRQHSSHALVPRILVQECRESKCCTAITRCSM